MAGMTVGEFVVKLSFDVNQRNYKKIVNNTVKSYESNLKKQFKIAEKIYGLQSTKLKKNFEKDSNKLVRASLKSYKAYGIEPLLKRTKVTKTKAKSENTVEEKSKDSETKKEKKEVKKDRKERLSVLKKLLKDVHGSQVPKGAFRFAVKGLGLGGIAGIGFTASIGAFIAKSLIGLNPKEALNSIATTSSQNRITDDVAKSIGISFEELKNYQVQGQKAGLSSDAITQLFLNAKAGGLTPNTVLRLIRSGINANGTAQGDFANLIGTDILTYIELVNAMKEGLFGKKVLKSNIDPNVARQISRNYSIGTTNAQQIVDAKILNEANKQPVEAIADAYIQSLNKVLLTQISDLTNYSKSYALSQGLRNYVELGENLSWGVFNNFRKGFDLTLFGQYQLKNSKLIEKTATDLKNSISESFDDIMRRSKLDGINKNNISGNMTGVNTNLK